MASRVTALLRERWQTDPFFLLSLVPLHSPLHGRVSSAREQRPAGKAYIGISAAVPSHRIVFATSIVKRALLKAHEAMDGLHLRVANCRSAQLYFPKHFASVSVSGITQSTLVLGAVADVLRVQGCRGSTFYAVTRRLIVADCEDCVFHIRTPTKPLLLGPRNARLLLAPHNTVWPGLLAQCEAAELPLSLPDRWSKPLCFASGSKRASKPDEVPEVVRLLPPVDFFPFAVPFAVAGAPNGDAETFLAEPPEAYLAAWRARLNLHQRLLDEISSLSDTDKSWVLENIGSAFREHLRSSGQERELEQMKMAEMARKKASVRTRSNHQN